MDDNVQNGLQHEQWFPTFEKGEKRPNSLGSGALRFIRTRSSIRRELRRQCNRNKAGDSQTFQDGTGGGGGGLGKWLREHLGGGSKASHDITTPTSKTNGSVNGSTGNEKPFGKTIYTSQNLYCSLPREHGRHSYSAGRKSSHSNSVKPQGHDRQRSSSMNHHEKTTLSDLATLTRGGPIYGSEGKTLKKRNRDRRRHSLNDTHEQGRQRRKSTSSLTPTFSVNTMSEEEFADDDIAEEAEYDFRTFFGEEEDITDEADQYQEKIVETIDTEEHDEEFIWDDEEYKESGERGEMYGEAFDEDEEVGEAEERISLSPIFSETEKFEEEARCLESEEFDDVLAEIPAEVFADRESMISKLKELLIEQAEVRRKNKVLEVWVSRHIKIHQKTMPLDLESMDKIYKQALRSYKMQLNEITMQQAELTIDFERFQEQIKSMHAEDEGIFNEFLDRINEVATGLVYAKTGKKMTDKIINNMIHRQISRRETLARDRHNYILLQHRLEELHLRLRNLETLGEGMTTMDYEALRINNITYKDKLDERNNELEKLRFKLEEVVNGVAHYKEKEICIMEDIECEKQIFNEYRDRATKVREEVNKLNVELKGLRETYGAKKVEAGLLMSQPMLYEMEKTIISVDTLKNAIQKVEEELSKYSAVNKQKRKKSRKLTLLEEN